jgi:hypothetical protein
MKMNIRKALLSEESQIISTIHFLKKHNQARNGIYYDDPLLNEQGIHLILYPSKIESSDDIFRTIEEIKAQRDVVKTTVIFVPAEWLI